LALVFKLLGEQVSSVRIVQVCGGGLAVGLICMSAWQLFGRRAGMVSGLMLALYGPAVFFDGIIQKTSLGCVLTCGLLACLTWRARRQGLARAVTLGVVSAALILTRENALVWLPILALWAALTSGIDEPGVMAGRTCHTDSIENGKRGRVRTGGLVRRLASFVLGVSLVLGPVGLRNWHVSGEWSVSTFQAGPNFYIGNHHGASGLYEPLIRGHETPAFERRDATALAVGALGRELSARDVSAYWMSRALSDMRSDPASWLDLMARKWLLVWNRYEVSDVESLHVYAGFSVTLGVLTSLWHFGLLCPLAGVGLWVTWRDRHRLWVYYALILSMAGSVALFYVLARYRFPLVPLLIPFAAAGCVHSWDLAKRGGMRKLLVMAVVGTLVAAVVNWPLVDKRRLDGLGWMNLGVSVAKGGDLDTATGYFRRAVTEYPESAEANNNLAMALAMQGAYAQAIPYYEAVVAIDSSLMGVAYNYGVALERVGRQFDALEQYQRAAELDPSDAEARAAVSRLVREK
jgi:tetratricopeptide (TPR) repeat protein